MPGFQPGLANVIERSFACAQVSLRSGCFDVVQMKTMDTQRANDRKLIDLLDTKVAAMERAMALKDVTIAELELRMTNLESTSYDGTLLWRITDFTRKRQEAVSGRITSVYSPPFYTSRTGIDIQFSQLISKLCLCQKNRFAKVVVFDYVVGEIVRVFAEEFPTSKQIELNVGPNSGLRFHHFLRASRSFDMRWDRNGYRRPVTFKCV
jgi:hypothetical protein